MAPPSTNFAGALGSGLVERPPPACTGSRPMGPSSAVAIFMETPVMPPSRMGVEARISDEPLGAARAGALTSASCLA
jgi:hypothetical protein